MTDKVKAVKAKSFSKNISTLISVIVAVLLILFIIFTRTSLKKLFEDEYNYRVLNVNRMVAAQIDGDRLEFYKEYREYDEYYFEMLDTLFLMQEIFEVDYLYIIAGDAEADDYVYIFDAEVDPVTGVYDDASFCSPIDEDDFPGAREVLETGVGFESAKFYSGKYGKLYYAYFPIFNSEGKAVAFLGTDIDATPMLNAMNDSQVKVIAASIILAVLLSVFVLLYVRRWLTKPMLNLTEDIQTLSKGDFNVDFSQELLERTDELGLIYNAFYNVTRTITSLISDMNELSSQVLQGEFLHRLEKNETYMGDYSLLRTNGNNMLESFCELLDMMPNHLVIYDEDMAAIYKNTPAKYCELLDVCSRQLMSDEAAFLDVNREAMDELYRNIKRSESNTFTTTLFLTDLDGDRHYYEVFITNAGEGRDTSPKYAVFTDVTEYMEMSHKAQASSRAKSEFLSRMSHEMRTPLNAIINMTELAKKQNVDDLALERLDVVSKSSKHLLTIINDVLEITRIDAGHIELVSKEFNLPNMMRDVMEILRGWAKDKDIEIKLELDNRLSDSEIVIGDEVRLSQVMINLLSNAIKFSPEGSDVIVGATLIEDEGKCRGEFFVRDFGIGINQEQLKTIFEPFEQGSKNISLQYGGTGLGLSISHKIISLMGGEMGVESTLGEGSNFRFSVTLDISKEQENVSDEALGLLDDSDIFEGRNILVVDDIDINREIVVELLSDTGAELQGADDGVTALEAYISSDVGYFDLVLMDIQMKVMDGIEATQKIRAAGRPDSGEIKIVALSANAFDDDIETAMNAGMNGYLSKPVDYDEMVTTIRQLILEEQ